MLIARGCFIAHTGHSLLWVLEITSSIPCWNGSVFDDGRVCSMCSGFLINWTVFFVGNKVLETRSLLKVCHFVSKLAVSVVHEPSSGLDWSLLESLGI